MSGSQCSVAGDHARTSRVLQARGRVGGRIGRRSRMRTKGRGECSARKVGPHRMPDLGIGGGNKASAPITRRWRVSKRFSLPRDMLPYERYGSREDNHAVGTIYENGLGGAQSSADEMVPRLTSSIRTTPALVTKRNIEPIIVRRSPYELDRGGFPMREIGIVERAYQLAREGKSLGEVRPQLSRDGFSLAEIEAHLAGPYLRAALRTLATKARAQVALDEADMGSGLLDRLSQVDGALVVGAHTSGDAGSGNMPTVHPAHTHECKAVRAAGDELSAPIRP